MINSNFLIFEEKLSFEELQKLTAILEMGEDYEKAVTEYHKQNLKRG